MNGPSLWPLWSWSAVTMLLDGGGGPQKLNVILLQYKVKSNILIVISPIVCLFNNRGLPVSTIKLVQVGVLVE